jgi:hypothetical protein
MDVREMRRCFALFQREEHEKHEKGTKGILLPFVPFRVLRVFVLKKENQHRCSWATVIHSNFHGNRQFLPVWLLLLSDHLHTLSTKPNGVGHTVLKIPSPVNGFGITQQLSAGRNT